MTTQTVLLSPTQETGFGHDLASLACDAAIELDNLIRDPAQTLSSVRALAQRLTKELPEAADLSCAKHLVDPSTVVVMSRVIREASWAGQPKEMSELTAAAGQISRRLMAVSDDTSARDVASLEQLRSFCLLLSKRAAAARRTGAETKPQHPYRKQG